MIERKNHFVKIDFLRGVAILYVYFFHFQIALLPNYNVTSYDQKGIIDIASKKGLILNFLPTSFGFTGVYLFLIISGFLIHLNFLRNKEEFTWPTFFSKRFWRIFPAYWAALLLFSLQFFRHGVTPVKYYHLFMHFFTLHNFSDATFYTINASFWSLALEVQLYLIYPAFLFLRKKSGIGNTLGLLIMLSVALLLFGTVFTSLEKSFAYAWSVAQFWFMWGAGAYLGEMHFNKQIVIKRKGWQMSGLLLILMMVAKYHYITNYLIPYIATLAWFIFFEWFLNAEFISLKNISGKLMAWIGLMSYSLYLFHQPIIALLHTFLSNHFKVFSRLPVLTILPVTVAIVGISYLSYRFLEIPFISLGRKLREAKKSVVS